MSDPSSASSGSPATSTGLPEITPDIVEQERGEGMEDIVPLPNPDLPPIVALGGSAGSVGALQAFFAATPPDCGLAFVVIIHLSPDHESTLASVLQHSTEMRVEQVSGRTRIQKNHVYVIPPGKNLALDGADLRLSEQAPRKGRHVAVDIFFRTLADTHSSHAAAIVISGADGDGALGIKRIKERGGLTIAQDLSEAEHDSMPKNAVATGMVDWVLPVAEMPARIIRYWEAEQRIQLPPETGPQPARESATKAPAENGEAALRDILNFLRVRTGRDFSYYKRATIIRRIGRRMQVNGVTAAAEYLTFLRTNPGESSALLQDLLISVTNFFRDREAFEALEALIPRLFKEKREGDCVRVWVAACATGEEAYSIAMMLTEYADTLPAPPSIQIFATDLDENAIQDARDAFYPEVIRTDVSEDRLRRFFVKAPGGFRIKRELRETVLFALHDLLKDSPFSRVDLVSCRNLMIYLDRQAQKEALQIFHFALNLEAPLFLGASESVEEGNTFFATLDKKSRLYVRRSTPRQALPVPRGPSSLTLAARRHALEGPVVSRKPPGTEPAEDQPSSAYSAHGAGDRLKWGERHFQLLEQFGPPSLVVNGDSEIVHLSENAGKFLHLAGGEPTMNLLAMAPPALRGNLRAALFRARQTNEAVVVKGLRVETNGVPRTITLHVVPEQVLGPDLFLVLFEKENRPSAAPAVQTAAREPVLEHLEQEIEHLKKELRETIEQSDASTEEIKASNEELQAMNEELRSATEELETGREELQSINEELTTVNLELKTKCGELQNTNNDLQNLMTSTAIATIFLTRDFRIGRYTDPAVSLFNLMPRDVGRPLSDLTHRLDYHGLVEDTTRVLENLAPIEKEIAHSDGRWFLARILPYRTAEDQIGGVVLTFVDISRRKTAEEALRGSETRFRAVADLVPDLLWNTDENGRWIWCNKRWLTYTGLTLNQTQGTGWLNAVHPEDREETRLAFEALSSRQSLSHEHRIIGVGGKPRWFLVRGEPVYSAAGKITQWFGSATDVDDYKRSRAALAASEERLRMIIENAREFAIFSMDFDRRIVSWNPGAQNLLQYSESEILGKLADLIFTEEDRKNCAPEKEAALALAEGRAADERWHLRKDGTRFWGSGAMMAMHDASGGDKKTVGLVKVLRDETNARNAREALEKSRQEMMAALGEAERAKAEAEAAGQAKDRFLAVLSHELRTPLTPVLMGVQLLQMHRNLPENAKEALDMISRNVQLEARFIDDLLDVSRLRHGKLEVAKDKVDLHEVIHSAIEVSRHEIQEKKQTVEVSLMAKKHHCMGDAMRLQQVVWNLVKNAAKFSSQGSKLRVQTRDGDGAAIVEFIDYGVGIRPEGLQRIFEAFTQEERSSPGGTGGLGLGLAIAKAVVDAHGGKIMAASAGLNQGATFTVTLPVTEEMANDE